MITVLKKMDLFRIYQGIQEAKDLKGVKFTYALTKNKRIIEEEIKALETSILPSERMKKYNEERILICRKHCKKDEKNEPVMKGQDFVIQNQKGFDEDLNELKEKYKEDLKEAEEKQKEYLKLLGEEIEMKFHTIALDSVPEEITESIMEKIFELVN